MNRRILFVLFLFFAGFHVSGQTWNDVLCISDLHFTPFNDPSVGSFFKKDCSQWNFSRANFSDFGQDANFLLIDTVLREMRNRYPNPNYIMITGDFLGHRFSEYFKSQCSGCSDAERKKFIANTFRFINDSLLRKYFPHTVVIPALGNNDAYTGNYSINPDCSKINVPCDSDFLTMVARTWAPLLYPDNADVMKTKEDRVSFAGEFSRGGYYEYTPPAEPNHTIIVLNTILFAAGYPCAPCDADAKGDKINTAADAEMKWLRKVLAVCRKKNKSVWLVYHIPPGLDYQLHLQWKKLYNDQFIGLLAKYRKTITANFAGHSHMDEFRVFSEDGKPFSFVHITPSISTDHKNNPAFQVLTYDYSRELSSQETYYFNLSGDKKWGSYNLRNTYGLNAINAGTLGKLAASDSFRSKYLMEYYTHSSEFEREKGDAAFWEKIRFGITNFEPAK
jgi:sphingomyelin phosphodiesterase acid-like 3